MIITVGNRNLFLENGFLENFFNIIEIDAINDISSILDDNINDKFIAEFIKKYKIKPLTIDFLNVRQKRSVEQIEGNLLPKNDPERDYDDNTTYPKDSIMLFYQFNGDSNLFYYTPLEHTFCCPRGDWDDRYLFFRIIYDEKDIAEQIKDLKNEWETNTKKWLFWIEKDVIKFNKMLCDKTIKKLNDRKETLIKNREIFSEIPEYDGNDKVFKNPKKDINIGSIMERFDNAIIQIRIEFNQNNYNIGDINNEFSSK